MAKAKIVVTRQLIEEAQELLDSKREELEIVQWQSEKVRCIPSQTRYRLAHMVHTALRPIMAPGERQRRNRNPRNALRQGR